MKAIRIIAVVFILIAAGCRSSADETTQISSVDAGSAGFDDDAATDDSAAESVVEQNDAMAPDPATDPDADADGVQPGTKGGDGVDEADGGRDPDSVTPGFLASVSGATVEAATARFEGRLIIASSAGAQSEGDVEMTLNGSYDLAADAFDISVDLAGLAGLAAADASPAEADMFASMFAEPVQLRSIGGTAWVRWDLLTGMFGAMTSNGGTAWIEAETGEAASMTGQFGVDSPVSPIDLLKTLADMDATVTEAGRETIRGVETTRYEILIDLEATTADLSPQDRAGLEAELPGGVSGELPIDLWMDDDGLVRRVVVELEDLDAMGMGDEADEIASIRIEFEIFDVGEPVSIDQPPADQVISSDDLGFSLGGDF